VKKPRFFRLGVKRPRFLRLLRKQGFRTPRCLGVKKPRFFRIIFNSKEGCDIPAELEGTEDERCLSFGLKDLKIT